MIVATDTRLSAGEAAQALGCSKPWVLHLIRTGALPATRTSLGHLVEHGDVERLRHARKHTATRDRLVIL